MNYAEKQKAEVATVSPRTIKINLSDEDVKRLYEKSAGASITPEQLIENFIADLVCGTYTNGSDERTRAEEWFERCWFSLDNYGSCIGRDIMPTEERGKIGSVRPTGWHTIKYDNVDGKYLYNRCHLIGYQLSGENANEQNLITGTRYLNITGMLPFEDMTANYVEETDNHVMYRVTPMFDGNNLLASGVLMEGYSVEDSGEGICFCVFCYNVQPDIIIDYTDGSSREYIVETTVTAAPRQSETYTTPSTEKQGTTYILNTNTKKFHYPSCSSVEQMKDKNKKEFSGDREDVISQGYSPCKRCNP